MRRNLKISIVIGILLMIAAFLAYKNRHIELPSSYYEFPIDSTMQLIQTLPSEVNESSGIIFIDQQFWTHNDSGDEPILYEMSLETGKILQEVTLNRAESRDWEDIAQDSHFVYIGDFGNNGGKREDLTIYKVSKTDLLDGDDKTETINLAFTYPDRINYNPPAYKHNFDCEAMIALEDKLFLFSKNHLDKHCRLYSLSKTETTQTAELKDRFDTKGMVTGAAIDKDNRVLALVGYNLDPKVMYFGPFVWLFWDYPDNDFFKGKKRRINLPIIAQAEGICVWKDQQFLIGTEWSRFMQGQLIVMDAKKWMD